MYDQIVSDMYKRKYEVARGHRLLATVITLKPISISRLSRFHLRREKFLTLFSKLISEIIKQVRKKCTCFGKGFDSLVLFISWIVTTALGQNIL